MPFVVDVSGIQLMLSWEPKFNLYWFGITLIYDIEQSNELVIDFIMQQPKLFDGYKFYFIGGFIPSYKGYLQDLCHVICIHKYKIEIQVFHGGSSCNFVFWNRECELLLGLSTAQLRLTMIKLLNLEMAFKVKWQSRWNNCSIVSILRDEPFIRQLKAPWDIDEDKEVVVGPSLTSDPLQVKESVDDGKTGVPKDCVKETDLEITSKHNPDPMTPIDKRDFPGGSSKSTTSDEFYDGHLSSNKLRKIIKLEKND
ncbi:unnamed protein product [Vicia faba]|uniref:Uncharacterized protein n=1 Tax=Vicia faba TaxID=3906 RepID=A0AAV0ZXT9_VICFA|nr:unnamed protein product [Vicia faba]